MEVPQHSKKNAGNLTFRYLSFSDSQNEDFAEKFHPYKCLISCMFSPEAVQKIETRIKIPGKERKDSTTDSNITSSDSGCSDGDTESLSGDVTIEKKEGAAASSLESLDEMIQSIHQIISSANIINAMCVA